MTMTDRSYKTFDTYNLLLQSMIITMANTTPIYRLVPAKTI